MPVIPGAAAIVLAWMCGAGPDAAQARAGVTCTVTAFETVSRVTFPEGRPPTRERSIRMNMSLKAAGATPFVPVGSSIVELTDAAGANLLDKPPPDDQPVRMRREQAGQMLMNSMFSSRRQEQAFPASATARGLGEIPSAVGVCRARLRVLSAARTIFTPVPPEAGEEPLEVAPGVSFLITDVTRRGDRVTMGYEVRIRRDRDASETNPQLSPIFAGLAGRDEQGRLTPIVRPQREIETRDEFIIVVKNATLDAGFFDRFKTLEAVTLDGVEVVTFDVAARDIDLGS